MATLTPALTLKQEKFCQKYIETGNASEAYRQSYNAENMATTTINRRAKDMIDNPKMQARIDELKRSHQERHNETVDKLLAELEQVRLLALTPNGDNGVLQLNVAINAIMGKAKLLGLDRQVIEQVGESTINIKVVYE